MEEISDWQLTGWLYWDCANDIFALIISGKYRDKALDRSVTLPLDQALPTEKNGLFGFLTPNA